MKIATVVIGDGRYDYLQKTMNSWALRVDGAWDHLIMVNDAGNAAYASKLKVQFGHNWNLISHENREGMAKSVRDGWEAVLATDADYAFHLEEDFTFNRQVNTGMMADMLEHKPHLAQLSLKRQPVNPEEEAAGGFIERNPEAYAQRAGYVEHQVVFSFNPCLIPRHVIELVLSDEKSDGVEHGVTNTLLSGGFHFGILGRIGDPPRVTHIGDVRSGGWHV